ncbi:MAG: hypothetical protein K9L62_15195 [Vallitaleaceae bacterium]|nr:hypothetical protein [Vallitaleaceae bacterium]
MAILFTLLWLFSTVIMILGIIQPRLAIIPFAKKSRGKAFVTWFGIGFLSMILVVATAPKEENIIDSVANEDSVAVENETAEEELNIENIENDSIGEIIETEVVEVELTKEEKFNEELSGYLDSNGGEMVSIDWKGDYGDGNIYIIIELKAKNDEELVEKHVNEIIMLLNKYEVSTKTDIVVQDISGELNSNLAIISIDEDRIIDKVFESPLYNTKYNQWVSAQFSVWDGSHTDLGDLIKQSLNDEKSYKHIETKYRIIKTQDDMDEINEIFSDAGYSNRVELNDLYIVLEFSAKNSFNATIKNTGVGIASYADNYITLVDIIY